MLVAIHRFCVLFSLFVPKLKHVWNIHTLCQGNLFLFGSHGDAVVIDSICITSDLEWECFWDYMHIDKTFGFIDSRLIHIFLDFFGSVEPRNETNDNFYIFLYADFG